MHHNRRPLLFPLLLAATVCAAVAGLCFGSVPLSPAQLWQALFGDPNAAPAQILRIVRLPHVAACLLAGAGLAVSGVLLQTATNNPLAGPNIIGVNAGAGFAMALGMCAAPMAFRLYPLFAFAGAFACTMLIVLISRKAGGAKVTIVLSGVAVSTLLNAGISLLRLAFPDMSVAYGSFSVGGVSGVTPGELLLPGAIILVSFAAAQLLAGRMNLLCLGDDVARSLGVRVKLLRTLSLILASACAAAAVSFAGLLGFVGLMIPHLARRLTGQSDARTLLPASALMGAVLVTLADLLGRILLAPTEIPAGVIVSLIGAPFFFMLLMQRRNRL